MKFDPDEFEEIERGDVVAGIAIIIFLVAVVLFVLYFGARISAAIERLLF